MHTPRPTEFETTPPEPEPKPIGDQLADLLPVVSPREIPCNHCAGPVVTAFALALCAVCYAAWQRDMDHEGRETREREGEAYKALCAHGSSLPETALVDLEENFIDSTKDREPWRDLIERKRSSRKERRTKADHKRGQEF